MNTDIEHERSAGRNPYATVALPDQEGAEGPDVTVVVIVYNDAEHLADAVESVRVQTLRNVEILICDDHSTDDTPEVARQLCAADSRISYHRLAQNSGGCGGPRNLGIESANGRYLMFLDSDDKLEMHACKNLLLAAEEDQSELVTGLMERRYLDESGLREPWYGWLYQERRRLEGIAEFPELSHDTTATNKLYSREFFERTGLRFPVDMHYEDIAFSARALTQARGISVIPELIYYWFVYPAETRKSITNQRDDEKNLRDRMFAIDIAQREFEGVSDELREEMELKILKHHLRLYVNDLINYDDARALDMIRAMRPYLDRISVETVSRLSLADRALYAAMYSGDPSLMRSSAIAGRYGSIAGQVRDDPAGSYWTPGAAEDRPVQTPLARALTDFSQTHFTAQAHPQVVYAYLLRSIRVRGEELVLSGIATDPIGKLSAAGARVRLSLRKPDEDTVFSEFVPLEPRNGHLEWTVSIPRPRRTSLRERVDREFYIESVLESGTLNVAPLRIPRELTERLGSFSDTSLLGRFLGDRWALASGWRESALLKVDITARGRFARSAMRNLGSLIPGKKRLARTLNDLRRADSKINQRRVYPLMRRFKIQDDLALFEANMGSSAFDNPRAVYEELRKTHPDIRVTWSFNGDRRVEAELPDGPRVRRGSLRYLWVLARAKFLVDNQSFPDYFVKRDGQHYLQTWHGIPYKKIGFDLVWTMSKKERRRVTNAVAAWDGLVAPSPYFEEVFRPAFDYHGPLVRGGQPRNDELPRLVEKQADLRKKLDIGLTQKVVLYAPTFRDGSRGSRDESLLFDLEKWRERFGGEVTLLIRSHYLNRFAIPESFKGSCIDVSDYGNTAELYAISDLLVTDYSSVMFDFAHVGRPIVIYAPDFEEFTQRSRGAYFDLREHSPGRFAVTDEELLDAVSEGLDSAGEPKELVGFREKFCGPEDGAAAQRSVAFLTEGAN